MTASRLRRYGAIFLVLLGVSLAVNAAVVVRGSLLSPADGAAYSDALYRAAQGKATVQGDTLGSETVHLLFCEDSGPGNEWIRGAYRERSGNQQPYSCANPDPDFALTTSGWVHPPTYFFAQAAGAKIVQFVRPGTDLLTAARLVAALWFALGGVALVILARLWGAQPWPATAVVAALAPTPLFVALHSYVTPDNTALVVGAGTLIAVTLWARDRLAAPWLFVAGLVCGGLIKQTFVVAAIAGVLLIGALVWQKASARLTVRRGAVAAAWLVAGTAVAGIAWEVVKRSVGQPLPPLAAGSDPFVSPLRVDTVLATVFGAVSRIPGGDSLGVTREPYAAAGTSAILLIALAGAAVGALMYRSRPDPIWPMAIAGVVGVGLGATLLAALSLPSTGVLLPPAPRYVMAAFPAYAVPLLVVARLRWVWVAAVVLAAVGLLSWMAWPLTP